MSVIVAKDKDNDRRLCRDTFDCCGYRWPVPAVKRLRLDRGQDASKPRSKAGVTREKPGGDAEVFPLRLVEF